MSRFKETVKSIINSLSENTKYWLILLFFAVFFGIVAHWAAYILEIPFLHDFLGWASDELTTPIIEESLKVIPFFLVMWKVSRCRDESFSVWRRVVGLLSVGMIYGFFEHSSQIPLGLLRLEWMWFHGSMTAISGFHGACFPFSVLLHIHDYMILGASWYRGLVCFSFLVSFVLLVAYKGIMILRRNKDTESRAGDN